MTYGIFCKLTRKLFSSVFVRKKISGVSFYKIHKDNIGNKKSTMELVNFPPVVSIYRHALRTFDSVFHNDLESNLNKLKTMMDALKAEDFGLDQNLINPATWEEPNKAPCTYIEVYQDSGINMSIFVLKPGFKMPLHDHPDMNGLLKVISGAARIRSFTERSLYAENALPEEVAARSAPGVHNCRRLFAEVTSDSLCSAETSTCTLTPTLSNYHEIEALGLPVAFFDILSPPYSTDNGPRICRYYQIRHEISTNLVELQETEAPECFYCDQAPYLGPKLSLGNL